MVFPNIINPVDPDVKSTSSSLTITYNRHLFRNGMGLSANMGTILPTFISFMHSQALQQSLQTLLNYT